jgi:CBS domain containing-hemolysin-like protein
LVLDRLATIPQPGEQVVVDNVRLTVKETSRRQIQSVIAMEIPPKSTSENPTNLEKNPEPT